MGSMENSYIRFLNLSESLVANSGSTKLDATEEQLLRAVMIAHSQGSETLVGDLLVLSHIGSQATLHGRVHNLIAAGHLKLVVDLDDGRKKKVIPTKQALKHYDNLSKLLAKAVVA